MSVGSIVYKEHKPRSDGRDLVDSIDLEIGGRVNIPELLPEEKTDKQKNVEVLETEDPQNYLTVHFSPDTTEIIYEFCFRLSGNVATLSTLTRMDDGKDCTLGWIPEEVRDGIHHHHPNMDVEMP